MQISSSLHTLATKSMLKSCLLPSFIYIVAEFIWLAQFAAIPPSSQANVDSLKTGPTEQYSPACPVSYIHK
ncbi:hypothetical protein BJY01DRAFT_222086 [Aspergillus pseudoustus]|uniref:Uncharacterized protein n=1 Tax=Aspergillus pseudoustus TaxID=1810923 RepID=A0ABR4J8I0_9EURO